MCKDGTTATTVLILNDSIFVANIGDSKAIVARFKYENQPIPVVLTVDHNPTIYEERMRIQTAGASVVWVNFLTWYVNECVTRKEFH